MQEEEKKGGPAFEDKAIIEAKNRKYVNELTKKYAPVHIDYKAVQLYFK